MRLSCLVNNHNYADYVGDAVRSALRQSESLDEVVVVDDGSTDGSLAELRKIAAGEPRVTLVEQSQGGQLSCFEAGFSRSTGDVVFFLDADDLYEHDYVERLAALYRRRPDVDFAFCAQRLFGTRDGVCRDHPEDRDLGCSAIATTLDCRSVGGPTSALSMRRWVLERVLPGPNHRDWRLCADACLVYGASVVGARKYSVAEPLVRRRIHGVNGFVGRERSASDHYRRRLKVAAMIGWYAAGMGLEPHRLTQMLRCEFRTIPRPTTRELNHYARIAMGLREPLWRRAWQLARLVSYYARTRSRDDGTRRPSSPAPSAEQRTPDSRRAA